MSEKQTEKPGAPAKEDPRADGVPEATDESGTYPEDPVAEESAGESRADAEADTEAGDDERVSTHAEDRAAAASPARGGSSSLAWLALFLALIAVAATGYSLVRDWRAERTAADAESTISDAVADLSGRFDTTSGTVADLERRLDDLAAASERTAADVAELQSEFEKRVDLLDSLPPRMSALENSVASLQGVSKGARDTWLLAEAEYYMQIANAQLNLAGNARLAAIALGMADERILRLANPALTDVRRALSDELAALETLEKPDIEGVSLTLASLARVVESLPLRSAAGEEATATNGPPEEQSGIDRAWASMKDAMSNLVKVTPPEQQAKPLMAPDSEQFLRTNLTLQLQAARLALLRGEQAVFEQSLDDATAWLNEYFDTRSPRVDSALETIAEIRDDMVAGAPPDISKSLQLLRQYRTLAETDQ